MEEYKRINGYYVGGYFTAMVWINSKRILDKEDYLFQQVVNSDLLAGRPAPSTYDILFTDDPAVKKEEIFSKNPKYKYYKLHYNKDEGKRWLEWVF